MFFDVFKVFNVFANRPGSTVHCIYCFSPPSNPGQDPGHKSGQKPGQKSCLQHLAVSVNRKTYGNIANNKKI